MAKERKRANGEGSVYKRKDGRWTARMTLPIGKRKDFFGKTRAEVNGKLIDAMKKHRDGLPVVNERQTVAQFLASSLESAKPALRTRTHVTYEGLIRLHVSPGIGRVILSRLTPQHLQRLYSERLAAGLSPQSVRHL